MSADKVCRARALRLRHGIPIRELAEAAGVSVQLISKIELEPERQTPGHAALLANAFETIIRQKQKQTLRLAEDFAASRGRLFSYEMEAFHE